MSGYIIPACAVLVIIYGLIKKVNVYDAFVEGAAKSLPLLLKILPFMAAMLVAITLMRQSGALEDIAAWLSPALEKLGMPPELVPLILLRPFSGSAAVAVLSDVFQTVGTDSFAGYLGSIMMGSSETIFYTLSLYFGSVGIQKGGYTLWVSLVSAASGVVAALLIGGWMYGV